MAFTMLRHLLAPLCLLLFTSGLAAAEIKFPLVGLGWEITFEGPVLKKSSVGYQGGAVQFKANSGFFNASLFVEPPPDEAREVSHAACRKHYWDQAKLNPMIDDESVRQSTLEHCAIVEYKITGDFKGQPFTQDNINCYFVHEGKWVDVHVSFIEAKPEDSKMLKKLASSLAYGPIRTSKGQGETVKLPDLGTAHLTPPAGWVMNNLLINDLSKETTTQHTLGFLSPTNPNATCIITFMKVPEPPKDRAALHDAVKNATDAMIESSVEKKAEIQDLKLKQGLGAVAPFTDASLVGKPMEPGNTKAIMSGIIVPKPKVLTIVSIFTDDPKGPEAKKMVEALETLTLE